MKNGAALIKWLKFHRSGKEKTFREFAISAKRLSTSINETEKGCAISSTYTAKHFCPTDFLSRLFQLLQVTAVICAKTARVIGIFRFLSACHDSLRQRHGQQIENLIQWMVSFAQRSLAERLDTRMRAVKNPFTLIAIAVMLIVFVVNEIVSWNGGPFRIMVWGGGRLADSLGVSYETVFEKFQLYRLLTYGYVQTAVWHLLANGFAFWSVGRYLEKRIGTGLLLLVYHTSLAAAGAFIFLFYPNSFNYGASPAIFSCFGLLTHWLVRDKALWRAYRMQKGFVYCFLFFVFSNFLGSASLVIHFLGFATGFLFGFFVRENRESAK